MLTKLPGIGKKTAERMVLELKDKIGTLENEENDREFAAAVSGEGKSENRKQSTKLWLHWLR